MCGGVSVCVYGDVNVWGCECVCVWGRECVGV